MNTKSHMTAKLRSVMRNLHFVEVWREMYPTSKIYLCYIPTHGAYSHLDRFLLANDGSLDVRLFIKIRFLSDHAPLLLECEIHIPKPAIPLWRLRPDLLGDPQYKKNFQSVLNGYFSTNWGTATARGIEWEALKVVIRGESHSKTYGIRKRLYQELTQQEDVLAALESQVDNGDVSDCLEVRGRIVNLWDRLNNYVCRNYRQWLFREGDRSGVCWPGSSGGSVPFPSSRCSAVLLVKRFMGQLRVNSHLRNIYATPCGVGVTRLWEYLDGLRMPRLMEVQSEEFEGKVSLGDLVEALGVITSLVVRYKEHCVL
ncbi:hypothetical protein NDU88_007886 [Pleurodeles waltl]|uniref:Uncharacterized protein n=1 Tax=Pleurodeles waltl TaxID=8319 RepID=A0AAV7STS0_PLEWA|nr:hypothetical protein NDU88_007886 [Pleurodeles waltl]